MSFISPTPGDVHISGPLTNIMVGYMQSDDAFVADQIFPNVPVTHQANAYYTYTRADWNTDQMKPRAPAAESAGSTYTVGQDAYYCNVLALHKDIPDQVRANADAQIDLDRDATSFLTHKARLSRELTWVNSYFKKGVWTYNVDGVSSSATAAGSFNPTDDSNNDILRWNDGASTPIENLRRAITTVQSRTGYRPNVLALGRPVFDVLVDHPEFIARMDRGQTAGPAMNNQAQIAAILGLQKVVVLDGIYNSAKQGQTEVNGFIGGKNALLVYAANEPSVLSPSAGYTFSWTGYLGATQNGARMGKFRMEHLKSDRVEIEMAYSQKIVGPELGYFFSSIIA